MPETTDPKNQPDPEEPVNPTPDDPTPDPTPDPVNPDPADPDAADPDPDPTPDPDPSPDPDPDPAPPSRREQLRVQQLLSKMAEKRQPGTPNSPVPDALNYDELDADPELIAALKKDREQAENARYSEGLRQAEAIEWRTMLHIDAPRIATKYPQFDKDSQDYHPALAKAMDLKYLQFVGYDQETGMVQNPGVRYADFVESEIEFSNELAEQKIAATKQNIAKQAANTGLRPNGEAPARLNLDQDPASMTDEELDAIIAQAVPQRPRR